MRKLLIIFFVAFILCISVFAGTIRLTYEEWIEFYNLPDLQENLELYQGINSGIVTDSPYTLDIAEDVYDDFKVSKSTTPSASDYLNGSSQPLDVVSDSTVSDSPVQSSRSEPLGVQNSDVSLASFQPVPTTGTSYTKPVVVEVTYAPDADSGTLTSALYSLIGKPVVSRTWQVKTGYNNDYVSYVTEQQDFDLGWCASLLLLIVVLWSIFKAGGALLSKT